MNAQRLTPFFLLLFLVAVGCLSQSSSVGTPDEPAESDSIASSQSNRTPESAATSGFDVTDRLSRRVHLDRVPSRVISLSPALTELLFAIGAGDRIVGATDHCDYPSEAALIPRIGGGTVASLSREVIVGLQPDLVIAQADTHEPLVASLLSIDIPIIALGAGTLDELFADARTLGKITGHKDGAEALIATMRQRLDRLSLRVAGIPSADRRSVFYEVWDEPLMTAGPSSFIGELIQLGGMENIFADTDQRYPKVSAEVVVNREPDVILAPSMQGSQVNLSKWLDRQGWQNIPAIQNEDVYLIDGDLISRCGPRMLDALESMIEAVYPETAITQGDR